MSKEIEEVKTDEKTIVDDIDKALTALKSKDYDEVRRILDELAQLSHNEMADAWHVVQWQGGKARFAGLRDRVEQVKRDIEVAKIALEKGKYRKARRALREAKKVEKRKILGWLRKHGDESMLITAISVEAATVAIFNKYVLPVARELGGTIDNYISNLNRAIEEINEQIERLDRVGQVVENTVDRVGELTGTTEAIGWVQRLERFRNDLFTGRGTTEEEQNDLRQRAEQAQEEYTETIGVPRNYITPLPEKNFYDTLPAFILYSTLLAWLYTTGRFRVPKYLARKWKKRRKRKEAKSMQKLMDDIRYASDGQIMVLRGEIEKLRTEVERRNREVVEMLEAVSALTGKTPDEINPSELEGMEKRLLELRGDLNEGIIPEARDRTSVLSQELGKSIGEKRAGKNS